MGKPTNWPNLYVNKAEKKLFWIYILLFDAWIYVLSLQYNLILGR